MNAVSVAEDRPLAPRLRHNFRNPALCQGESGL
jgi:hypothetical protein